MKQRKTLSRSNVGKFKSQITFKYVMDQYLSKGAFEYSYPNGDKLIVEKSTGEYYSIGKVNFTRVAYGQKEVYGGDIGTVFMLCGLQVFSRKNADKAVKCFIERLHGDGGSEYGPSERLEEIARPKRKVQKIVASCQDIAGCGRDGYDKHNMHYIFLTNFNVTEEDIYIRAVETYDGNEIFGIADEAFGYDEDIGTTFPVGSHKGLYVRYTPESETEDLSKFWSHFDQVQKNHGGFKNSFGARLARRVEVIEETNKIKNSGFSGHFAKKMPFTERFHSTLKAENDKGHEYIDVRFEMTPENWTIVVTDALPEEVIFVVEENQDNFLVSYPNQTDFDIAVKRFNGMIKYTVEKHHDVSKAIQQSQVQGNSN